jgi:hypothetical protein
MHFDTGAEIALYIVLAFVLIFALVTVVLIFGLVFALKKLNELIETGLQKVSPVIDKTSAVLDTVNDVTTNVGAHADTILTHGEQISATLAKQVDATASVVSKTVTSPLVNMSSVLAGISKGLGVFGKKSQSGKNGSSSTYKSDRNGSE